ncbi:MAG: O-antigen ligase family protein [Cytophagales bacterium]|nr:O-antigen ligase family protein [Cytophagales bacterium]
MKRKNQNKWIALLSVFLLMMILLVNYFDLNGSLMGLKALTIGSRVTLWDAAIRANPNPLFGVGTGDYKAILNQYYQSQGMALFVEESYNSHNQFIQLYLQWNFWLSGSVHSHR